MVSMVSQQFSWSQVGTFGRGCYEICYEALNRQDSDKRSGKTPALISRTLRFLEISSGLLVTRKV